MSGIGSLVRSGASAGALFAVALLSTGCGIGTSAPAVNTTIQSMSGAVHGGQSPIQGATVTLYHTNATATAYGAAATVVGTATSDVNGSYTIAPSATAANCPAGQQAYITAAGGYQSGQSTMTNTNVLMVAALGNCSNIGAGTYVIVNEVTTVAAAYALSGFMTTAVNGSLYQANVSAPVANNTAAASVSGTAPAGLAHAFLNALNLANFSSGMPNATVGSSSATGIIPVAEVNTLADAMAACVNTKSSGTTSATQSSTCNTLFTLTPSISGAVPANTLQAFMNLARNPYPSAAALADSTGLLSLTAATSPFQPVLSTSPNDWSLAVVWGKGSFPTPYWNTLDANDTFYMGTSTVTAGTTPGLYAVSAYGATVPGFAALPAGTTTRGIGADSLGNIWIDNNSTNLYQYSASAGTVTNNYTTLASSYGLAVDKKNNIWVGHSVAGVTNVDEFANTSGTWASNYTASAGGGVYGLAVDGNQNIWPAQYVSGTTGTNPVNTQAVMIPNTGTAANAAYTPTTGTTTLNPIFATLNTSGVLAPKPYYSVFDASGNAWLSITGSNTVTSTGLEEVVPNTLTGATSLTPGALIPANTAGPQGNTFGSLAPQLPAIDGAGMIFAPDNNTNTGLHMFATTATAGNQALSPTTGIKGCYLATSATATCGTGSSIAFYNPRQIQVDSTGSVWTGITNGGAAQAIGLAAPSYPLLSAGLPGLEPGRTTVAPLP